MVGWSDWLSTAASLALVAIVFAEYAGPLIPDFPGEERVVAGAVVLLFAVVQWRGVKSGDVLQQLLTILKAVAFTALSVAALVMVIPERAVPVAAVLPVGTALIAAFVIALQSVIFTFDGWTGPLYFGDETVDAGRSIPRAMVGACSRCCSSTSCSTWRWYAFLASTRWPAILRGRQRRDGPVRRQGRPDPAVAGAGDDPRDSQCDHHDGEPDSTGDG